MLQKWSFIGRDKAGTVAVIKICRICSSTNVQGFVSLGVREKFSYDHEVCQYGFSQLSNICLKSKALPKIVETYKKLVIANFEL